MAIGVTVADLVERTRENLQGPSRGELNFLAEDLDSSETAVDFAEAAGGIRPGSYIECVKSTATECMYVRSVTGSTATVVRAQLGTSATTFTSGDTIRVEQSFWTHRIQEALKEDIVTWPGDVYKVVEAELSVGASADAVDLGVAAGRRVVRQLSVQRSPFTDLEQWVHVPSAMIVSRQETDDFASGWAVQLPYTFGEAVTLRVVYGIDFDVSTFALSTDLETVGLTRQMVDIPVLGACWRLLGPREALRVQTAAQGQSGAAEAVPPTAITRTSEWFYQQRQRRLGEEAMRLLRDFPWHG